LERNEDEVVKYIEPVFHFCVKRLNNRHDAEDLASEIMVHILNGVKKYQIDSLEKWVWRIAHNRYARFINMRISAKRYRLNTILLISRTIMILLTR
jgi:DNA-directed RNA polymerase specialized sigma24 family protein